jgi:Epoxide hydrolase N terminus
MTEIDGLDIHFIHVRSPHENALPLIITYGWPGSIIDFPGTGPSRAGLEMGHSVHRRDANEIPRAHRQRPAWSQGQRPAAGRVR